MQLDTQLLVLTEEENRRLKSVSVSDGKRFKNPYGASLLGHQT